ncbi:hypothetical protein ABEX78_21895 [Priestia megaterium]
MKRKHIHNILIVSGAVFALTISSSVTVSAYADEPTQTKLATYYKSEETLAKKTLADGQAAVTKLADKNIAENQKLEHKRYDRIAYIKKKAKSVQSSYDKQIKAKTQKIKASKDSATKAKLKEDVNRLKVDRKKDIDMLSLQIKYTNDTTDLKQINLINQIDAKEQEEKVKKVMFDNFLKRLSNVFTPLVKQ